MKLGIDLGSSNTKSSKGTIFTSKISKNDFLADEENQFTINENSYYLENGNFDTEYRKAVREDLINLLYISIFKSSKDTVNDIAVGLPPGQYKQDQYLLQDRILKQNKKSIIHKGEEREILIRRVAVLPEGVLCTPANFEGISIDIGGRTTDITLIELINGRKTINQAISYPQGTQNLYSSFINEINKRGLNLKENEAERILRNGLYIYGEKQDIKQELEIYNTYVLELVRILQLDFSLKTNNVLITGGGGQLLFNYIKKHIKNAELIPNSIFANAIMFGRFAEGRL